MSNTRELYAQYRTAARAQDNAGAYRILKQICAADPGDRSAAAQLQAMGRRLVEALGPELDKLVEARDTPALHAKLAEAREWAAADQLESLPAYKRAAELLKGRGHGTTGAGGSSQATALIYKQYREASLAHDDETAFRLLEQITAQDPEDQSARLQKRDTGRRLCTRNLRKLAEALRSGDPDDLATLVGQFRQWADEPYLATLKGYEAAAARVDEAERIKAGKEIACMLAELRAGTPDTAEAREKRAVEIEELAGKHGITPEQEDAGLLAQIHTEWQTELEHRKRCGLVEESAKELKAIEDDYTLHRPLMDEALEAHLATLGQIGENALALCDTEEGKEHFAQVQAWQKKLRMELALRRHKRTAIRRGSAIGTGVLVLLGGCVLYALAQADSVADNLQAAREGKNAPLARDTANVNGFMDFLYSSFSSRYRLEHKACTTWLNRMQALQKKGNDLLAEMKPRCGQTTLETLAEDADLFCRFSSVWEEMQQGYGVPMPPGHVRTAAEMKDGILRLQSAAYSLFSAPPHDADMATMARLYKQFKTCVGIFAYTEEDCNTLYMTMWNKARDILLKNGKPMTEQEINAGLDLYKQYVTEMDLPRAMQDELQGLKEESKAAGKMLQALPSCTSLSGYMAQLRKCPRTLARIKEAYPVKEMEALQANLQAMAALQAAQDTGLDTAQCSYSKLRSLMEMFRSGTNAFYGQDTGGLSSYLDKLTIAKKPKEGQDYYTWSEKGTVYVGLGQKTTDGNIRCSSKTLNRSACTKLSASAKQLERMGLVRLNVLKGNVLPVEMLTHIAENNSNTCPVLLKAYLFGVAIDLMEHYADPMASGIPFSPLLQNTIRMYREEARLHPVTESSWSKTHSAEVETAWTTFFNQVKGNDYRREIQHGIDAILQANLEFAGYVDAEGSPYIQSFAKGKKIYCVPSGSAELQELQDTPQAPYTPLFVLKKGK